MAESDLNELIQRLLDGEATPEDRAELDRLMSASAATRAEYESLRDLVRQLDTYPMAEAPHLRAEILERLRGRGVVAFESRKRRAVFGIAWAAAAVVVIGIALAQYVKRDRVESGHVAATMAAPVALDIRTDGDLVLIKVQPVKPGLALSWEPQQLTFSSVDPGIRYDGANNTSGVLVFSAPANEATVVLRRAGATRGPAFVRVSFAGREILKAPISSK